MVRSLYVSRIFIPSFCSCTAPFIDKYLSLMINSYMILFNISDFYYTFDNTVTL